MSDFVLLYSHILIKKTNIYKYFSHISTKFF